MADTCIRECLNAFNATMFQNGPAQQMLLRCDRAAAGVWNPLFRLHKCFVGERLPRVARLLKCTSAKQFSAQAFPCPPIKCCRASTNLLEKLIRSTPKMCIDGGSCLDGSARERHWDQIKGVETGAECCTCCCGVELLPHRHDDAHS